MIKGRIIEYKRDQIQDLDEFEMNQKLKMNIEILEINREIKTTFWKEITDSFQPSTVN